MAPFHSKPHSYELVTPPRGFITASGTHANADSTQAGDGSHSPPEKPITDSFSIEDATPRHKAAYGANTLQECGNTHVNFSRDGNSLQAEFGSGIRLETPYSPVKPRAPPCLMSRSALLTLALNTSIAAMSIYFIAFAVIAKLRDGASIDARGSEALLAAAQLGPTIFATMFAAIIGRSLKSAAATFLETGSTIGLLECLLGGRTVAGAATLPFSVGYYHPVMVFLVLLWALSPLGGQAALRVLSPANKTTNSTSMLAYLDMGTSPFMPGGRSDAQYEYGLTVVAGFYAALYGSSSLKGASQDPHGNLKVPFLEDFARVLDPDTKDFIQISADGRTPYSCLVGIPLSGGPQHQTSISVIESNYMYANCTLEMRELDESEYSGPLALNTSKEQHDPNLISNGLHLMFRHDPSLADLTRNRPLEITMMSRNMNPYQLTTAFCKVTTTYVELQVVCEGDSCRTSAIRRSLLPHTNSNLTVLDGIISGNTPLEGFEFLKILANLTILDRTLVNPYSKSALENYFIDPDSPFSVRPFEPSPPIGSIGEKLFSHRLTQLMNTLWFQGVAPYALAGNFTSPSNGAYQVTETEAIISETRRVLHCNDTWLAVLFFTSFAMLAAGLATATLDALRRGPQVLDSFVFALRDNKYVRVPVGSSLDDSADMAKRLCKETVRFGDVHSEDEVGHMAIGTPSANKPIQRLRRGRFYI